MQVNIGKKVFFWTEGVKLLAILLVLLDFLAIYILALSSSSFIVGNDSFIYFAIAFGLAGAGVISSLLSFCVLYGVDWNGKGLLSRWKKNVLLSAEGFAGVAYCVSCILIGVAMSNKKSSSLQLSNTLSNELSVSPDVPTQDLAFYVEIMFAALFGLASLCLFLPVLIYFIKPSRHAEIGLLGPKVAPVERSSAWLNPTILNLISIFGPVFDCASILAILGMLFYILVSTSLPQKNKKYKLFHFGYYCWALFSCGAYILIQVLELALYSETNDGRGDATDLESSEMKLRQRRDDESIPNFDFVKGRQRRRISVGFLFVMGLLAAALCTTLIALFHAQYQKLQIVLLIIFSGYPALACMFYAYRFHNLSKPETSTRTYIQDTTNVPAMS